MSIRGGVREFGTSVRTASNARVPHRGQETRGWRGDVNIEPFLLKTETSASELTLASCIDRCQAQQPQQASDCVIGKRHVLKLEFGHSLASSFHAQLASVMESLLTAAVREISSIFEGSLSASRGEIARGREEALLLRRQLEALEGRLQEANAVGGTGAGLTSDPGGTGAGLTSDPASFALSPDDGPGAPVLLPDLFTHGEGRGQASRVKEDVEVTELESVTFSQEGAEISIVVKEESLEQDLRGLEALGPRGALPGAGAVKGEGAGLAAAPRMRPAPPQNPELLVGLLTAKPRSEHRNGFRPVGGGQGRGPGGSLGNGPHPASLAAAGGVTRSGFPPVAPDDRAGDPEVTAVTGPSLYPPVPPQGALSGPAPPQPRAPGPAGDKPYPCPRCSKAFVSPSHLSVHTRVHTGERPYRCAQCGKSFAHNGNLRAHQRQVHLGRRPYPCPECGKRFSKRGNLRTHLQQVHLGAGLTSDPGGTGAGLTSDPASFALSPDLAAGPVMADPLLEGHLLPKGDSGPQEGGGMPLRPQEGGGMPLRVKEELEVTELQFVSFTQDGVHIKEESMEENLESLPVEGRSLEGRGLQGRSLEGCGLQGRSLDGRSLEEASRLVPGFIAHLPSSGRQPEVDSEARPSGGAAGDRVGECPAPPPPRLGRGDLGLDCGDLGLGCGVAGGPLGLGVEGLRVGLSESPPLPDHAREVSARETKLLCAGREGGDGAWTPAGQRDARFPRSSHSGPAAQRCPLSASAVAMGTLKQHLGAHLARERPYVCPYCGKAFFYPSQQRRHLLRHTGQRQHPCPQCDRSFVTASELSVHARVHTGERPYRCAQCGRSFNRNGNLRAHTRDVHQRKRPYACAECGKTFSQKGNLRTHQRRLHRAQRGERH
ncbi:hypothetical protein AAFF_G00261530 [Aldrovandia affinis]|uniref:C2H2-type domain-containing protein n=1 Tax=Aldrovandia affinis TaxID=143900 RepID=A0AAD7RBR5_9TELE|nr:hypothetical protein AAFF_G00261530 [Aldrovandia affinis]